MSIIRTILYGAVSHGANFRQLCKRLNLNPEELLDSEKLVHWEKAIYLWDYAIEMTGDDILGLHLGEEVNPSSMGMLGYLMQSCPTIGDAIATLYKYNAIYSAIFEYAYKVSKEEVFLIYEPLPMYKNKYPESARQSVDMTMSAVLKIFSILSGKKTSPLKAEFTCSKRRLPEYERIFRSQIFFNADRNCLTFNKDILNIPVITYDKSLFSLFNTILEQKQKSLQVQKSFAEQVRQVLIFNFKGQIPPIDIIASELCLSTRTFQRNLSREKMSYRAICNELRKELAVALIENNTSSTSDVAALLGYADLNSFRRAFKVWTQQSSKDVGDRAQAK